MIRRFSILFALLFSPLAFAAQSGVEYNLKSQALSACQAFVAAWDSSPADVCNTSCVLGSSSYSLTLRNVHDGSCIITGGYGEPTQPWFSGLTYTSKSSFGATYYFNFLEEDEPIQCPGPEAPEVSGWKAPTASGTGNVCLDGCILSIALSPPPGPLYLGQWTGQACPVYGSIPAVPFDPLDPSEPSPFEPEPLPDLPSPTDPDPDDQIPGPFDPEIPEDGEWPEPGEPEPGDDDPKSPPGGGDGSGEGDDGGASTGGLSCDHPPACSGKPIECAQLYQQWNTRCEVRSGNERSAKGIEGLSKGLGNAFALPGDGDPWGWTGIDELGGKRTMRVQMGMDQLDTGGFLNSYRSCPSFDDFSIEVLGHVIDFNLDNIRDNVCLIFEIIGILMMIFGAFYGYRILMGGNS